MATTPVALLVLDLECTGLDPAAPGASILEIASLLVTRTPECELLAQASLLVRPPGTAADHDRLWASLVPEVRAMHEASGLWQAVTRSVAGGPDVWSIHEADTALAGWLRSIVPEGVVQLAGSGVDRLDFPWIRAFMPRLNALLHYRALDISPIREALQVAGWPGAAAFAAGAQARPHRALPDCEDELAELRTYLRLLGRLPVDAVDDAVLAAP